MTEPAAPSARGRDAGDASLRATPPENTAMSPAVRAFLLGVVLTLAVLAVDVWRTRAALEVAARGGVGTAMEAFDGVA